ncbi:MAG: DNA recombination protein RmuC [Planctomycetes bacterium]|nr:DNA recombination protein RmuC [Planctomycetota bacterium]
MPYILPAVAVLVSLLILAIILKQYAGARAGAGPVEGELRQRIADLDAEAAGLRDQLDTERAARVQADTRLEAERRNIDEQRDLLAEAETRLKDAFAALSADALKNSSEQFLGRAEERLRPIRDLLKGYEEHLREIEKARNDAYGGLRTHLDALALAHQTLQKEAHQLSTALRSPTVRGRWGEMTLRRVVEVAGMSPHCDFDEQTSVTTEEGRLRPDMTIHLPGRRLIVVDSKVPLAAYMDATEAPDQAARQAAFARHAGDVRKHVQALSAKAYWNYFPTAPDFVVLFLPGESFFSAALEQDRTLMEDAMRSHVFLATPTTLMALLNVVAHGWHQQEMAENAEKIGAAGKELFERVAKFVEHFAKVGEGLNRAAKAYDGAVGSYESRVRPSAERLAQQAALTDQELPDVPPVDGPSRAISLPDDAPAALPPPADETPDKPQ